MAAIADADRTSGLALVLTGGGARAAYQVGVLEAIAEKAPGLEIPILTGASAGAINAAYLADQPGSFPETVRGLKAEWARLTADVIYGPRSSTLVRSIAHWLEGFALGRHDDRPMSRGFFDTRPLRAFLERATGFRGIEPNIARGRLRAIGLTATSYSSGLTTTFVQASLEVPLWQRVHRVAVRTKLTVDHLMASSAIPIVFPAVKVGDEYFGDGSVRQTFPLSPAIHLGARKILAIGTRPDDRKASIGSKPGGPPALAQSLGLLLDSVFLDHLDADAEVLESVNRLQAASPAVDPFRKIDFLLFRPSRDLGDIARECADRLPRIIRTVARGLGAEGRSGSEFMSYLLFDPTYTSRLVELGHADGLREWDRIRALLLSPEANLLGRAAS